MTLAPDISTDKTWNRARWLEVGHVLAVLTSAAVLFAIALQPRWVMPAELFPKLPAGWLPSMMLTGLSCLGLLTLVIAPRWPAIGLLVFVILAYAFPRVGYDFNFFLRWHILEFVSVLSALGYCVWLLRKRRWPVWFDFRSLWLILFLMAWVAITTVVAAVRGNYSPAANHHPILMLNALVMFILAVEFFRVPRDRAMFVAVLALTLCLRGFLAPQWVKGNGDLGVLLAMSIPLTTSGILSVSRPIWRGLFVLATVAQGVLLFRTNNRGGALAIVAAVVSIWLMSRHRLKLFLLTLPVLFLAGVLFISTPYWQKFEDIWQDGYWKKTVDSRIGLWGGGWRLALDSPVFGVGMGNFEHRVGKYTSSGKGDSPHNNIVGMLAETGFPGVLLYLAFFVCAICLAAVTARRSADSRLRRFAVFLAASIVAYFVGGMFMTRHTMTLAYLLAGGALAVSTSCQAPPRLFYKERVKNQGNSFLYK